MVFKIILKLLLKIFDRYFFAREIFVKKISRQLLYLFFHVAKLCQVWITNPRKN
jgi:hypothetical protein